MYFFGFQIFTILQFIVIKLGFQVVQADCLRNLVVNRLQFAQDSRIIRIFQLCPILVEICAIFSAAFTGLATLIDTTKHCSVRQGVFAAVIIGKTVAIIQIICCRALLFRLYRVNHIYLHGRDKLSFCCRQVLHNAHQTVVYRCYDISVQHFAILAGVGTALRIAQLIFGLLRVDVGHCQAKEDAIFRRAFFIKTFLATV